MKATEAKLLQVLGAVSRFIILIDQRTYSWSLKECHQLWADLLRACSADSIGVHFIGSVVHIDEGLGEVCLISLVQLAAMADLEHEYHQLKILDAADHAIIA